MIIIIPPVIEAIITSFDEQPSWLIYVIICGPEVLSIMLLLYISPRLRTLLAADDRDDEQEAQDRRFKARRI
jgi:hypothetical protein